MIITVRKVRFQRSMARQARGYTLVEILVVLFVLMLLAAIALPTVKDLLSNQKTSRAARRHSLIKFEVERSQSKDHLAFSSNAELACATIHGLSQSIRVRHCGCAPTVVNVFVTLPHPSNPDWRLLNLR